MTQEELDFEFDQLQMFMGGKRNAGYLAETKSGKKGRTYHTDALVNGKQPVYCNGVKLLCSPETLKVVGFID